MSVTADRQIVQGDLRISVWAVFAERDRREDRRGSGEVSGPRRQRWAGHLCGERSGDGRGQAGERFDHSATVLGIEKVKKSPCRGSGLACRPDDDQGELSSIERVRRRCVQAPPQLGVRGDLRWPSFGGLRCQLREHVFVEDHLAAAVQRGLLGQAQERAIPSQQGRIGLLHHRAPVAGGVAEPDVGVHDLADRDHCARTIARQESGVPGSPSGVAEPMRCQPHQRRRGGLDLACYGLRQDHRAVDPQNNRKGRFRAITDDRHLLRHRRTNSAANPGLPGSSAASLPISSPMVMGTCAAWIAA